MAWTDPASPEQFSFIEGLMKQRQWEDVGTVTYVDPKTGTRQTIQFDENRKGFLRTREAWQIMTKLQASVVINILKSCPYRQEQKAPSHQGTLVPFDQGPYPDPRPHYEPHSSSYKDQGPKPDRGRYFLPEDPFTKKEAFFKVSKNEDFDPPWIRLWAQASNDFYEITNPDHRRMVYDEILKDPVTAMNEYGKRLEICGRCGRELTQKDSRLRGLGPDCAAIVGAWLSPEDEDIMSRLGLLGDK